MAASAEAARAAGDRLADVRLPACWCMPALVALAFNPGSGRAQMVRAWLALHLVERANPGATQPAAAGAEERPACPVLARYTCWLEDAGALVAAGAGRLAAE
jgi:hypothetical protein